MIMIVVPVEWKDAMIMRVLRNLASAIVGAPSIGAGARTCDIQVDGI